MSSSITVEYSVITESIETDDVGTVETNKWWTWWVMNHEMISGHGDDGYNDNDDDDDIVFVEWMK